MDDIKICVVGLGYVGLPLAVALGKKFNVIGFDINEKRIAKLKEDLDVTDEVSTEELKETNIEYTSNPKIISESNFIIVAVPTPITKENVPDLSYLESASELIAKNISKGSVVVYESTFYPGVTEEICVPLIEKISGLKYGKDFKAGYSPERINPGDKVHTVDKIVKVIAGFDEETTDVMEKVYGSFTKTFRAKNIKTAEASKVIENTQRDVNIALINEFSTIFHKMGIVTKDVVEAASTKWNFHPYQPGLVGGHCIGIDPYYMVYKAQDLGIDPKLILSARKVNEYMSRHVAQLVLEGLSETGKPLNKCNILIMGLTFKENITDYRNSKAKDLITELKKYNLNVVATDPYIGEDETQKNFSVDNIDFNDIKEKVDCVVLVVPHSQFDDISFDKLKEKMNSTPIIVDVKSFYEKEEAEKEGFIYKCL